MDRFGHWLEKGDGVSFGWKLIKTRLREVTPMALYQKKIILGIPAGSVRFQSLATAITPHEIFG